MSDQLSAGPAAGAGALLGVGGGAGGGGGGIASHPLYYYSTHNALRAAEGGENFFPVTFVELHGKRSCKINVYPFCDVQMVKRILLKKMNLSSCMQVCAGGGQWGRDTPVGKTFGSSTAEVLRVGSSILPVLNGVGQKMAF